jgi:hypothetical protein
MKKMNVFAMLALLLAFGAAAAAQLTIDPAYELDQVNDRCIAHTPDFQCAETGTTIPCKAGASVQLRRDATFSNSCGPLMVKAN